MASISVSSIPFSSIAPAHAVVTVNRRDSKENGKVPTGERFRAIQIPELTVPEVPSKFATLVLDALYSAASSQLSQLWQQAGWAGCTEVPAEVWTVDALLMFAAREAESKRLSKDSIAAWYKSSNLCARVAEKKDAALAAKWEKRILSLAAPALSLSEEQCNVIIATIGKDEDDAGSQIGAQIISKLAARVKKLQAEAAEVEDAEEI